MKYEELRTRFIQCQKAAARLGDLEEKANELSPERAVQCQQEIDRLHRQLAEDGKLFTRLHEAKDPAWSKMTRELDTAMEEYQSDSDPLSIRHAAKTFVGTMCALIIGSWIIDGLRRR